MWYIYIIYDCQLVTVDENKEIKKKTKKTQRNNKITIWNNKK